MIKALSLKMAAIYWVGALIATPAESEIQGKKDTGGNPVEITVRVDPFETTTTSEPSGRWGEIVIDLRNHTDEPLVAWSFEVRLNGELVDGYEDLLVLKPVAPGARQELRLFRVPLPPGELDLEVALVEAWTGELKDGADSAAEDWRLITTLEGLPIKGRVSINGPS